MPAGKYRHRLVIQIKTETQTRSGAVEESWADYVTIYGGFEPLGSREFPIDQKRYAETTARFPIRYRSDLTVETYRIIHNGQTWDIHGVLPVSGRNIELNIEASEVR